MVVIVEGHPGEYSKWNATGWWVDDEGRLEVTGDSPIASYDRNQWSRVYNPDFLVEGAVREGN